MKVHHFGLAVKDIERAAQTLKLFGYSVAEPVLDTTQGVSVLMATQPNGYPMELVCDIDEGGPTESIVKKMGPCFYHVCFEVDDLDSKISQLSESGFLIRHKPASAAAFDDRRIAWMYSRDVGLVELLEAECKE